MPAWWVSLADSWCYPQGTLPGFPRGCQLLATIPHLFATKHWTSSTGHTSHELCGVWQWQWGTLNASLSGKSPKPQGHTGNPFPCHWQSVTASVLNTMLTYKSKKQKDSSDSRGKAGAKNMQKGFCLCSPLSGRLLGVKGGELWLLKMGKEQGRCSTKALGFVLNYSSKPITPVNCFYILQNNWPDLFKNIKMREVKERLSNCPIVKETKKTWQLNITYDLGLDPGSEINLFLSCHKRQ